MPQEPCFPLVIGLEMLVLVLLGFPEPETQKKGKHNESQTKKELGIHVILLFLTTLIFASGTPLSRDAFERHEKKQTAQFCSILEQAQTICFSWRTPSYLRVAVSHGCHCVDVDRLPCPFTLLGSVRGPLFF